MLEELKKLNIILPNGNINSRYKNIFKKHLVYYKKIIKITNFLINPTFSERIYCITNNITKIVTCKACHTSPTKFIRYKLGYHLYCSTKCSAMCNELKKIKKETKLERYGDENWNNIDKAKETKLERYGDENYSNRKKFKKTCNNKPQEEIDEIITRRKHTNLNRYNHTNYLGSTVGKNKSKQTKLERYGDENYNNRKQYKETCIAKFGVDNPFKSDIIKIKIKQTCLTQYGDKNYRNIEKIKETWGNKPQEEIDEITRKQKQTKLQEYGDDIYNNRYKFKKTCQHRYNRDHISQIHISTNTFDKLNDKKWLQEHHYNQQKSLTEIARELNVSDVTVGAYLHYHGLDAHLYNQGWLCESVFENNPELANKPSHLYIIHCYNETESFIKIGITKRTIESRYNGFKYQYEILIDIELPYRIAWRAEQDILNQFKEHSYKPNIKFGGQTECLNESCYEDVINYLQ